jgi:sorbose reductase
MSLPQINLSTASNPLTGILPKTPGLTPAERAVERFSVSGNAIGEFGLSNAGICSTLDIVTGGTGGLGFEACRALLEHGLLGLSIFDLASGFQTQASVQQLRDEFPSAKIIEEILDVSDEKSVHQGVENAVAQLGSVNILLCFAGIARASHSAETSLEEWQKVIAVNSTGSWLCAQAVGR